jgi:hypothetical protein
MDRVSSLWILVISALTLSLVWSEALAVEPTGSFGLGIMAGEPTGFTGAYTLSPKATIDGDLAYGYERQSAWRINSDYIVTGNRLSDDQISAIDFYFGGGLRLKFSNDTEFGFRVPVGMTYQFSNYPIQAFGELAPIMDVVPGTQLSVDVAIGARYFF